MTQASPASSANRRAIRIATAAFVIQGLWAIYANHSFGTGKSLTAGAVQGASSFLMTYLSTMLIEYILAAGQGLPKPLRFVAAAGSSILATIAVQFSANWAAGTPALVKTIAPAVIMGGAYAILYSFGRVFLGRRSKTASGPAAVRTVAGAQGATP